MREIERVDGNTKSTENDSWSVTAIRLPRDNHSWPHATPVTILRTTDLDLLLAVAVAAAWVQSATEEDAEATADECIHTGPALDDAREALDNALAALDTGDTNG